VRKSRKRAEKFGMGIGPNFGCLWGGVIQAAVAAAAPQQAAGFTP